MSGGEDGVDTTVATGATYPFAFPATGSALFVIEKRDPAQPGSVIAPELVAEVAAIDGVVAAAGTNQTLSLTIHAIAGDQAAIPVGPVHGATWLSGSRQFFLAEIVDGDPPQRVEFAIAAQAAEIGGLVIGETYTLRADGEPVQAKLSGLFTYEVDLGGMTPVLVDPETALRLYTSSGRYRTIAVDVDSEGDPVTTLEAIRAVLSEDLQLVSRSRVNREEPDQELMAAMCEHLEEGGNDLIEIIEMARTADGDNRFSRAFVAAASLRTVCPTWTVDPEASEFLRNLHERLMMPQSRSDATTADLFSFWEDTCAAADEGKLLDEHPTGLAIGWDDPSATADAALFGFMFMCPDARNTIVELIDAG